MDSLLTTTLANAADFTVEFGYEPADRSVGLSGGFTGVTFSLTLADALELHVTFEPGHSGEGDLTDWPLFCVTSKVLGEHEVRHDINPLPRHLSGFPVLLKAAQDHMAAMQAEEQRHEDEMEAAYQRHVEDERAAHEAGRHGHPAFAAVDALRKRGMRMGEACAHAAVDHSFPGGHKALMDAYSARQFDYDHPDCPLCR